MTLGSGDMLAAVRLPEGEDENEWLAVVRASSERECERCGDAPCCGARLRFSTAACSYFLQSAARGASLERFAMALMLFDCGCSRLFFVGQHVVDFFNEVSLLYGTITDFCTPSTCPTSKSMGREVELPRLRA